MIFPKLKDSLPLNARVRRGGMWGFDPSSFFDQGAAGAESWGEEEETPAEAQAFIGNNQCFPFMANDASLENNNEGDSSSECEGEVKIRAKRFFSIFKSFNRCCNL